MPACTQGLHHCSTQMGQAPALTRLALVCTCTQQVVCPTATLSTGANTDHPTTTNFGRSRATLPLMSRFTVADALFSDVRETIFRSTGEFSVSPHSPIRDSSRGQHRHAGVSSPGVLQPPCHPLVTHASLTVPSADTRQWRGRP